MTSARKLLYVLVDGARARFVERRPTPPSFATFEEIDARDRLQALRRELRASPRPRNRQTGSPGLEHTLGRGAPIREEKQRFVAGVAERTAKLLRDGGYEGLVVAAPDRLLAPLRRRLQDAGTEPIAINRDLTKTPDAGLTQWLEPAGRLRHP